MTPVKKGTTKKAAPKTKAPAKKAAPKKKAPAKKAAPKKKAPAKRVEAVKEAPAPEGEKAEKKAANDYIYTIGRRKTSVAQVRFWPKGAGEIEVNDKDYTVYFPAYEMREIVVAPLKAAGREGQVKIVVQAAGGGVRGQAEAVRLGISRALIELDPDLRKSLKKLGFLTRDSRRKERKKPGLKKARRAPQWAKR